MRLHVYMHALHELQCQTVSALLWKFGQLNQLFNLCNILQSQDYNNNTFQNKRVLVQEMGHLYYLHSCNTRPDPVVNICTLKIPLQLSWSTFSHMPLQDQLQLYICLENRQHNIMATSELIRLIHNRIKLQQALFGEMFSKIVECYVYGIIIWYNNVSLFNTKVDI